MQTFRTNVILPCRVLFAVPMLLSLLSCDLLDMPDGPSSTIDRRFPGEKVNPYATVFTATCGYQIIIPGNDSLVLLSLDPAGRTIARSIVVLPSPIYWGSTIQLTNGNYVIAGAGAGTDSVGHAVASFDRDGHLLWSRSYAEGGGDGVKTAVDLRNGEIMLQTGRRNALQQLTVTYRFVHASTGTLLRTIDGGTEDVQSLQWLPGGHLGGMIERYDDSTIHAPSHHWVEYDLQFHRLRSQRIVPGRDRLWWPISTVVGDSAILVVGYIFDDRSNYSQMAHFRRLDGTPLWSERFLTLFEDIQTGRLLNILTTPTEVIITASQYGVHFPSAQILSCSYGKGRTALREMTATSIFAIAPGYSNGGVVLGDDTQGLFLRTIR